MRGKLKNNNKSLTLVLLFLITSISVSAQDYAVTPLSDLLKSYSQKYADFSKEIENSDIDSSKKLFVCANKLSELKADFKSKRSLEYKTKSVKRAKRMSCKGGNIRGITKCSPEFIKAPDSNLYTKDEWITIEGSDKATFEVSGGSSVTLKMSATGTRLNEAVVYAVYKYKPDAISAIVDKETNELFNLIIKNSSL